MELEGESPRPGRSDNRLALDPSLSIQQETPAAGSEGFPDFYPVKEIDKIRLDIICGEFEIATPICCNKKGGRFSPPPLAFFWINRFRN